MIPVFRRQDEQKTFREAANSSTMKNLVALLFMISVLVIPAFSKKCHFCESCTTTCEKETEVECGTKRCMTYSKYVVVHYTNPDITFRKGCADESLCERGKKSRTMSEEIVHCCSKNLCNTQGFEYFTGYLSIFNFKGEKPKFIRDELDIPLYDSSKNYRVAVNLQEGQI
ncbi:uncharacterized protein ACNLHF_002587 [Anomaloglossus baeobatrachus]